jgi:hypothetical protein
MIAMRGGLAIALGASIVAGFGATPVVACAPSSPTAPSAAAVLSITSVSNPPVGEGLTDAGLSLPVGTVAEIAVSETDDGGDDASILVRADDSTFAIVAPTTTPGEFVVIGVAPGSTAVRFFLNGQETTALAIAGSPASALALDVVPQPAPL